MSIISRTLSAAVRTPLKRILTAVFIFFQKLGINITPNHYYQPIPDLASLKAEIWQRRSDLPGIIIDDERALALLDEFRKNFHAEYTKFPKDNPNIPGKYYLNNRDFGPVDAEILYCMVRHFKPKKIIEIGSGHTTLLTAQAVTTNKELDNADCEFIAIEPFPREMLIKGLPGLSRFIQSPVQDVSTSVFAELGENDILFIDSSHVLKTGSDVQYEFLEILPRLKKGVIIHIHDVFLPMEYPRSWLFELFRFWNEQYLLQAFLAFNDQFEVIWPGSYMHLNHPEKIKEAFPSYNPPRNQPGSFWMQRI